MKSSFFWTFFACVSMVVPLQGQTPSTLWGKKGELWNGHSRLPDFSFAGYHYGEIPIPNVPVTANVRDFGARGDGIADDTTAFQKALSTVSKGAIMVPTGRYVLTSQLGIERSGVVLRGEGIGKTVLVIPKSLEAINGAQSVPLSTTFVEAPKSKWAFHGGFIEFRGKKNEGQLLAKVAAKSERGETRLTLDHVGTISAGAWIQLKMDNNPELGRYLHAGLAEAAEETRKEIPNFCDWVTRVVAVDGNTITLERPLRMEVRPEWNAQLFSWQPGLEESGVESLSFEFAGVPKKPHLTEEGFNAIQMLSSNNCWVKDVEVIDADNAVNMRGCRFCTVEGLLVRAANRQRTTCHHALSLNSLSQDCLLTRFKISTVCDHELTVEGFANGNVFENGEGTAIALDHHRNGPYENLFTQIKTDDPKRLWKSSGRQDRGPHSAGRTTVWNVAWKGGQAPKVPDWPQINVIGLEGIAEELTPDKAWIEPCAGGVTPPNLYRAQLQRRVQALP